MSTVFFDVGLSLDGYMAGPNRGPQNPLGDGGVSIHQGAFKTATFLERVGATGGERSPDDRLIQQVFERTGAYVMGRRMFDGGEVSWPENPPFRAPVFVLTHGARPPWVRKGGTTFFFVTDGVASALKQGLVDEFTLRIAPVLLGSGLRLLDQLGAGQLGSSPLVTHVRYRAVAGARR